MAEDVCIHEIQRDRCGYCGPAGVRERERERRSRVLVESQSAVYEGRCPSCRKWIHEGDLIHLSEIGWVCEDCD